MYSLIFVHSASMFSMSLLILVLASSSLSYVQKQDMKSQTYFKNSTCAIPQLLLIPNGQKLLPQHKEPVGIHSPPEAVHLMRLLNFGGHSVKGKKKKKIQATNHNSMTNRLNVAILMRLYNLARSDFYIYRYKGPSKRNWEKYNELLMKTFSSSCCFGNYTIILAWLSNQKVVSPTESVKEGYCEKKEKKREWWLY